jgi:hypothetical protein
VDCKAFVAHHPQRHTRHAVQKRSRHRQLVCLSGRQREGDRPA